MNQSTEAWNAGILIVGSHNNIMCGGGASIVSFDPQLVVAVALIGLGGMSTGPDICLFW